MTLITENGTGLSNAESYISVTDADTYHAAQTGSATWSGATTSTKEMALRQATAYIDSRFAERFKGTRVKESQALRFPRIGVIDIDGFQIESNVVPPKLAQATAELALEVVSGTSLFVTEANAGSVKAEMVKIGEIAIDQEFAGSQSQQPKFPKVEALLKDLLHSSFMRFRA